MPIDMTPLMNIPPEVILEILTLTQLIDSSDSEGEDEDHTLKSLSACRLSCKYLNNLAQPFIFKSINLGMTDRPRNSRAVHDRSVNDALHHLSTFLSLLTNDSTIGPSVKKVQFYGYQPDEPTSHTLAENDYFLQRDDPTTRFWHNPDLPMIFDSLSSVNTFTFNLVYRYGAGIRWGEMSGETRGAMRRLISLPCMTRLEVTNVTGFPIDVITDSPNLGYLHITNIDLGGISVSGLGLPSGVHTALPEIQNEDVGKLQVLPLVKVEWNSLLCFRDISLASGGGGPEALNAILRRSKHTLRDLGIQFLPYNDAYSTTLNPPLEQYASLRKFKAECHQNFSSSFITIVTTFFNRQFGTASSRITQLEIHARFLPSIIIYGALKKPPMEWYALDKIISSNAFPELKTLVISTSVSPGIGGVEVIQSFVKRVLPMTTEKPSIKVLLRMGHLEQVDMTGFTVAQVAAFAQKYYGLSIMM